MHPPQFPIRTSSLLAAAAAFLTFACGDDAGPDTKLEDASTDAGVTDSGTTGTSLMDGSIAQIDASMDKDAAVTSQVDTGTADATTSPTDASAGPQASPFSLRFAYTAGDRVLGCGETLTAQGLNGKNTVDINDLRFFVSDLRFLDKDGKDVALTLDKNDFQLSHAAGALCLVDLTSNEVGGCTADAFPNSEGTKRVHEAITGSTLVSKVASVRFNVGVPQPVMKKAIQENTAEGQPSPLGDLQWPWSVGWRHFALNFGLKNEAGQPGIGFVHLGSLDCSAAMTDLALSDRESCTFVNNPAIVLDGFSLTDNLVTVDIPTILKKLDFVDDLYDDKGNVTGQGPGVGCHSGPSQPDCPPVFEAFGMSLATGKADPSKQSVFGAAKR
jgi:uncharacterized repeat protein (TIGR04052 family)